MFILEQQGSYMVLKIGTGEKKRVYIAFSRAVPVAFVEATDSRPGTAFRLPMGTVDRHGNAHATKFLNEYSERGAYDVSYYADSTKDFDARLEAAVRRSEWTE